MREELSFGELRKEVVSDPGPRTPEGTGGGVACGGVPRGFKPYALRQHRRFPLARSQLAGGCWTSGVRWSQRTPSPTAGYRQGPVPACYYKKATLGFACFAAISGRAGVQETRAQAPAVQTELLPLPCAPRSSALSPADPPGDPTRSLNTWRNQSMSASLLLLLTRAQAPTVRTTTRPQQKRRAPAHPMPSRASKERKLQKKGPDTTDMVKGATFDKTAGARVSSLSKATMVITNQASTIHEQPPPPHPPH